MSDAPDARTSSMTGRLRLAGQWVDVTDEIVSGELVFAARHQGTGCFVSLVPTASPSRGALNPDRRESTHYRRVVRPGTGEAALQQYCKTHKAASKMDALDATLTWLRKHQRGLPEVVPR